MNIVRIFLLAAVTAGGTLHAALPGGDALGGLITENFDDNADALVDRDEWLGGIGDSFSTIDTSGDNAIVPDEIDGLRKEIATQTGDGTATLIVAIIKQLILLLDTDRNQSVSREEYEALGGGVFDKLDANKDGTLSRAELAALPVKLLTP
jgi:hypothetical protein